MTVFVRTHANGGTSVAVTQADLNDAYARAVLATVEEPSQLVPALLHNLGIAVVVSGTCDDLRHDGIMRCFLRAGHPGPHAWQGPTAAEEKRIAYEGFLKAETDG